MKKSRPNIYIIRGYKPSTEAYGPQDSDIIGYCNTEEFAKEQIKFLENEYLPVYLNYSMVDMIGWRYNNDIEEFIKKECKGRKIDEDIIRKDWEKWSEHWKKLKYEGFDYEKVVKLD